MSDGFGVGPEATLAPAAQRFRGVADEFARALGAVRGALGALGDVCGGDEQGRAFAAAYQPRADDGLRTLDALTHVLASIPETLGRAAMEYRRGDQAAGRDLARPP